MKKAVFSSGSKQYIVSEGDEVKIELLNTDMKTVEFPTLLIIDNDKIQIGKPTIPNILVKADIIDNDQAQEKVTSIRFKAKKRVHKVRGHRQHLTVLKIKSIN